MTSFPQTDAKSGPVNQLLTELLLAYEASGSDDVSAFLAAWLGNRSDDQMAVIDVVSTLARVDRRVDELNEARKAGEAREDWFERMLLGVTEGHSEIPALMVTALSKANDSDMATVVKPGVEQHPGVLAGLLMQGLQDNTLLALQTVSIAQDPDTISLPEESKLAKAILVGPDDAQIDREVATLAAGSLLQAQRSGWFDAVPELKEASPVELALIADRGIELAKVGYKLATGELSPQEAIDGMIDRAVARLIVHVERAIVKASGDLGEKIGAGIGSAFGPPGAVIGAMVGRALGEAAGRVVAQHVSAGIQVLAEEAKSIVHTVVEKVVDTVSSFVSGVKSLFGF